MSSKQAKPALPPHTADENVAYIRQMLGELRFGKRWCFKGVE